METKEVLITSVGLYPQLVTLTLDLLLEQPGRNVTDVVVFHTQPDPSTPPQPGSGREKPADLMAACLEVLRREFRGRHYHNAVPCRLHLTPLTDSDGIPLQDVLTPAETLIFWESVHQTVSDYKTRQYRAHLSVAAGRKPMVLYTLTTAQVLLSEDDFVWNLVTEARAEQGPLHLDEMVDGKPFDAELVRIRFIPARDQVQVIFDEAAKDPEVAVRVLINRKTRAELEGLLAFMGHSEGEYPFAPLTPSEAKIARQAARGHSQREIAVELYLSHHTVKRTLSAKVYRKVADWFKVDRGKVSQTLLAYLLRPYLDWCDKGQPPLD